MKLLKDIRTRMSDTELLNHIINQVLTFDETLHNAHDFVVDDRLPAKYRSFGLTSMFVETPVLFEEWLNIEMKSMIGVYLSIYSNSFLSRHDKI
jgi:hypothetical protein